MKRWCLLTITPAAAALIGYGFYAGHGVEAAQAPPGTARILAKIVLSGTPPAIPHSIISIRCRSPMLRST